MEETMTERTRWVGMAFALTMAACGSEGAGGPVSGSPDVATPGSDAQPASTGTAGQGPEAADSVGSGLGSGGLPAGAAGSGIAPEGPSCIEESRVAVSDPTVASEGFARSIGDIVAALSGTWLGECDGTETELVLGTAPTNAEAIRAHWEEETGLDVGGLPPKTCAQRYEFDLEATLTAGARLDESFVVHVTVREDDVRWAAHILLAEVAGSERPDFDPNAFEEVSLSPAAALVVGMPEMRGAIQWLAAGPRDIPIEDAQAEDNPGDDAPSDPEDPAPSISGTSTTTTITPGQTGGMCGSWISVRP